MLTEFFVKRGVKLLNRRNPGWHEAIDLRDLDMDSPWCCVLGQLYHSFTLGLMELKVWGKGTTYGFFPRKDKDVPILDALWKQAILDLRAK